MKLPITLLALAICALPFVAVADDHDEKAPALTDVWIFVPKADMQAQFSAAMQDYMAWRAEMQDSRSWTAFTPVVGHKMDRIMFRTCCFDWADQDSYLQESMEKGYGDKFDEMVAPYIDHHHRYIDQNDFENSYWTEDEKGPYFGATTWYLNEAFTPQAYEARKTMSAIAKDGWASDTNQWLWITTVGGASTLTVVTPFSNWAEMAPPEVSFFDHVSEKLESEEEVAELFANFSAGKVKSDYTVWRINSDLSSPDED